MTTQPISGKFCAVDRLLAVSHPFNGLDPALLTQVAAQTVRGRKVRGTPVFEQGTPADALYLITSGIVKLTRSTADVELNILGLFGPRECVGVPSFLAGATHAGTAYAATDSVEYLRIPINALNEGIARDARLAAALLRATQSYADVLTSKVDVLSAGSVSRRLARLFLALGERFGDELEEGSLVIPVSLSRRELSLLVGSCMESVIRVVSAWQKQGLLRTSANGFELIAPSMLREVATRAEADRECAPPLSA
ncbi:MAG: Crp/Fnr family transcriptional regulator [Myxococcota bacterium]